MCHDIGHFRKCFSSTASSNVSKKLEVSRADVLDHVLQRRKLRFIKTK